METARLSKAKKAGCGRKARTQPHGQARLVGLAATQHAVFACFHIKGKELLCPALLCGRRLVMAVARARMKGRSITRNLASHQAAAPIVPPGVQGSANGRALHKVFAPLESPQEPCFANGGIEGRKKVTQGK